MSRTAIWIVNTALVVGCCFMLARILTEIAADVLVPTAAAASVAPPDATQLARGRANRQVIVERNLFNVSSLAPKEESPELSDERYEATRLPLELLGTAVGDDETSLAAVLDLETRTHLVARVGDKLKDRAAVMRIERRRIVLLNGGKLEELGLEDEKKKPGSRAGRGSGRKRNTAGRRAPRGNPRRNADRFNVARSDIQKATRNPAELFSQARILPRYQDGKMQGVQLNSIKPGSIFENMGIQEGDVITELNGIEIKSQQDSAKVMRELTTSGEVKITACEEGGGSCRELTYEIEE